MNLSERAAKLFKSFHQREAAETEIVDINGKMPVTCMLVGEMDGIIYRTKEEPKGHIHRFTKGKRPLVWVTADGKQMFITGGVYRFTDRGFMG